ncbi:MAG TPA: hypothetical protein DCL41_08590 [Bdellovibrionales bacterium]|nr:hypothetical protein [Pseudobdellovibrionaceae bacterium]HAG91915.1 hypothetical protein [Bdellovibrionales bacterium]|tara:strand:- start:3448 stop:3960 length:513 start_codon:yes stop_codon:yes gene_type:complete
MKHSIPVLVVSFLVVFSGNLFGESLTSCEKMDLKKNRTGVSCETQQGAYFKKVENGILETESKLIVDLEIRQRVTQKEALDFCEHKGMRLPTIEEFQYLESAGFQEAFRGDMKGQHVWQMIFRSSSSKFGNPVMGQYAFNANRGYVFRGPSTIKFEPYAARCIRGKELEF